MTTPEAQRQVVILGNDGATRAIQPEPGPLDHELIGGLSSGRAVDERVAFLDAAASIPLPIPHIRNDPRQVRFTVACTRCGEKRPWTLTEGETVEFPPLMITCPPCAEALKGDD